MGESYREREKKWQINSYEWKNSCSICPFVCFGFIKHFGILEIQESHWNTMLQSNRKKTTNQPMNGGHVQQKKNY